ncbi:MAG: CopG family transcriptional regulator [Clostridia bacterium]|nr:CopG family transcriptional regulator [Clostridia bacterium]
MAVRTQIYLSEKLYKRVKARAAKTGKSMAEQIRESLERYLDEKEAAEAKPDDPIWKLAGQIQSTEGDLSSKHDTYLYGKENKR